MSEPTAQNETEKRLKARIGSSESSSVVSSTSGQNDINEAVSQSLFLDDEPKGEELLNLSTRDLRAYKQKMEADMARKKKAERAADRLIREEAERKEAETARKERARVLASMIPS